MEQVTKTFYHFSEEDFTDIEVYSNGQDVTFKFWGKEAHMSRRDAIELMASIRTTRFPKGEYATLTFDDGFELSLDFNTASVIHLRLTEAFRVPESSSIYKYANGARPEMSDETFAVIADQMVRSFL